MKTRMLLAAALAAGFATLAGAADWPSKPVRLLVPFPAGGPTDGVARLVAAHMEKTLGQPMVVENKPGADGAIAAQSAVAAPADGHTLLFATSSVMGLPAVTQPPAFQLTDLAPIGTVGRYAFGLFVSPQVPGAGVADLVAYARKHPGELNYASANLSEQMAAAQFLRATSTDMVRVNYKGASQALPDLLSNRVQVYLTPLQAGLQQANDGRLKLLATLEPSRSRLAPAVPSAPEAGLDAVGVPSWQMIVAPAKAPQVAIEKIARALRLAVDDPQVRAQLEDRGLQVQVLSPAETAAMLQRSAGQWAAFARDNGLAR